MQQRQVTIGEAFSKFWKTWSVEGRASCSEFWWAFLANFLVSIAIGFVGGIIGDGGALSGLYSLAALVPGVCMVVRRLHDVGKSGWFSLIALVPFIGGLILLYFEVQPSEGANQYGETPNLEA